MKVSQTLLGSLTSCVYSWQIRIGWRFRSIMCTFRPFYIHLLYFEEHTGASRSHFRHDQVGLGSPIWSQGAIRSSTSSERCDWWRVGVVMDLNGCWCWHFDIVDPQVAQQDVLLYMAGDLRKLRRYSRLIKCSRHNLASVIIGEANCGNQRLRDLPLA